MLALLAVLLIGVFLIGVFLLAMDQPVRSVRRRPGKYAKYFRDLPNSGTAQDGQESHTQTTGISKVAISKSEPEFHSPGTTRQLPSPTSAISDPAAQQDRRAG